MRIIVTSAPKTGNSWVKTLLARAYRLEMLGDGPSDQPESLRDHVERGWFRDNAIIHQHFWPYPDFLATVDRLGARLVTSIRHPYGMFNSLYHYVQNFPALFPAGHPLHRLLGKPIDHPDVLDWLADDEGFGAHIGLSAAWCASPATIVTRYADLHADPVAELRRITRAISPIGEIRLRMAVRAASAKRMRRSHAVLARHVRSGTVEDWANHLGPAHFAIFAERYRGLVEAMGYSLVDEGWA